MTLMMTQDPSRRGWKAVAFLVGIATAAGLSAWGAAPWLATLVGVTPVLLAVACAIPCLLPLVLLWRGGRCGATRGRTAAAACRCEPDASRLAEESDSPAPRG